MRPLLHLAEQEGGFLMWEREDDRMQHWIPCQVSGKEDWGRVVDTLDKNTDVCRAVAVETSWRLRARPCALMQGN